MDIKAERTWPSLNVWENVNWGQRQSERGTERETEGRRTGREARERERKKEGKRGSGVEERKGEIIHWLQRDLGNQLQIWTK